MPTPFMHMAFAQRVVADDALPPDVRAAIDAHWGAFLLGSIAPDARVSSGIRRADTHFFEYEPVIATPPITAMLTQYPMLNRANVGSDQHAVFIAAYGAHLAMDEIWCTDLLFPKFMNGWADGSLSFQMLHMLLGWLDARDLQTLPLAAQYPALAAATPDHWLPFIPDEALIVWRDTIASQIAPEGSSRTLEILSQRIKMNEGEMRAFINSPDKMDQFMWQNVSRETVAAVEVAMYARARSVLLDYLQNNVTAT